MANIKAYLEDILKAVYGEEVRGSIHDAIEAINNNVLDNREEVKGYADDAQRFALSALQSWQNSMMYSNRASGYADDAESSATQAASSASNAESSSSDANSYATRAQSWAVGGTSSRDGEDTNNAKYYSDQAQRAAAGLSGALSAQGTITFKQLSSVNPNVGWMYNISTDFVTDERFAEGSGVPYKAGTNVYWTANSQWDCLAAGAAEENKINTVKVNGTALVPDAEKAVDVKAYNEDNKPEVGGRNLLLDSGTPVTSNQYLFHSYSISDKTLKDGEKVTITAKAQLGSDRTGMAIFNTDGTHPAIGLFTDKGNGYYQFTGEWKSSVAGNVSLAVFIHPISSTTNSTIEWIKLERGEIPTDWTPAPEDLEAEIPTKTSQLENDSKFITQADILEGATASNTVPKAPTNTGSVGTELAFARGDHTHPMQPGIANVEYIPQYADLNNYLSPGSYSCISNSAVKTLQNCPETENAFLLLVIPNGVYDNTSVSQLIFDYAYNIIYRRTCRGSGANYFWTDWVMMATVADITANNFSGILPIEKGGTGGDTGSIKFTLPDNYDGEMARFYKINSGSISSSIGVYADPHTVRAYIAMTDTPWDGQTGIIVEQTDTPNSKVLGKYNGKEIATLSDYATTTTAGLVKPGTGLEVTSDGTLNVTGGGSSASNQTIVTAVMTSTSGIMIRGVKNGTISDTLITPVFYSNYKFSGYSKDIGGLSSLFYKVLTLRDANSSGNFNVMVSITTSLGVDMDDGNALKFSSTINALVAENVWIPATGYILS